MPCLPNWSIKGPFIYASPTQHILRGLCFEGSGFDSVTFYMTVFFLPLCVPTKIVSLTFGKRLRRAKGESWDKNDPELISALRMAVTREALPFLSEVESLPSPDFISLLLMEVSVKSGEGQWCSSYVSR